MADRWFRVPRQVLQDDPESTHPDAAVGDGPKYRDMDGIGSFAGNRLAQSDQFVVRYYAPESVLDEVAAQDDTTELPPQGAARLFASDPGGHLPDIEWTATTVNEQFSVTTTTPEMETTPA